MVRVTNLHKHFRVRGTRFRSVTTVQAVSGVDLELRAGRCLALVGESGCGKSTVARLLLRLDEPTSGSITLNGRELTGLPDDQMRAVRRQIQMVFQDPYSSLNPRLSVGEIVGEPLLVHKIGDRAERVRESAHQRRPGPGERPSGSLASSPAASGSGSASRARWHSSRRRSCSTSRSRRSTSASRPAC